MLFIFMLYCEKIKVVIYKYNLKLFKRKVLINIVKWKGVMYNQLFIDVYQ